MTYQKAAEHLRQLRQQSRNMKDREALQMAEQALLVQDRQTQFMQHWQAWARQGAK